MQFNEKPTTSYVIATNNDMGALFSKDKEGECLTLSHWVKPIKTVNYPFLVFLPNHLFLLEFG